MDLLTFIILSFVALLIIWIICCNFLSKRKSKIELSYNDSFDKGLERFSGNLKVIPNQNIQAALLLITLKCQVDIWSRSNDKRSSSIAFKDEIKIEINSTLYKNSSYEYPFEFLGPFEERELTLSDFWGENSQVSEILETAAPLLAIASQGDETKAKWKVDVSIECDGVDVFHSILLREDKYKS